MGKKYIQLKEITLDAILEEGAYEGEWIDWLIKHGFIKEKEKWEKITLRDLCKIRPGVKLKRIWNDHEEIIHITSDPYWASWVDFPHILLYRSKHYSSHTSDREHSINDLFNGDVYLKI